jgi:hypothetical protein
LTLTKTSTFPWKALIVGPLQVLNPVVCLSLKRHPKNVNTQEGNAGVNFFKKKEANNSTSLHSAVAQRNVIVGLLNPPHVVKNTLAGTFSKKLQRMFSFF